MSSSNAINFFIQCAMHTSPCVNDLHNGTGYPLGVIARHSFWWTWLYSTSRQCGTP